MIEYILVNGELYLDHDHDWNLPPINGMIPVGSGKMNVTCGICEQKGLLPFFFDGRHADTKWEELEII